MSSGTAENSTRPGTDAATQPAAENGAEGGSTVFELERHLPHRLSCLDDALGRLFARRIGGPLGLTIHEWQILAVLGAYDPLSAGTVGRLSDMDKVQVSRALSRLIDAHLVDRRIDPRDRRRSVLRLSAEGRTLHAECVARVRALQAELSQAMSPDEAQILGRLLGRLAQRAHELEKRS